jgi:prepilin-type processing-associated H-X9-DG protein
VKDDDISPFVTSYFRCPLGGYGPCAGEGDDSNGIFRYAWKPDGTRLGSRKLAEIHRPSQIWLGGEVGVPKVFGPWWIPNQYSPKDEFAGSDYLTGMQTFPPRPDSGWSKRFPAKQPACRHNKRAVFSLFDGHAEAWKWSDLRSNKMDVFGIHSL